jgi:pimeloyl-ACP methyl ester carboxylesterase
MSTFSNTILAVAALSLLLAAIVLALKLRAERRHPPIGEFLECDGVRLHYLQRGPIDGPVVVLLHGNGTLIQDFMLSGLLDLLARRYRVICFDRPGFGYSTRPRLRLWTPEAQADLLAGALRRLGIENALVVGHSWGALVAVAMAMRAPDLVRSLVLVSGYYFPTPRKDVWLMSGPAVPLLGDFFCYTLTPFVARAIIWKLVRLLFAPREIPEIFRAQFPVGLTVRPGSLRASAEESAFLIPAAARLKEHYASLPCPAAVVVGDGDKYVLPEQGARLQKILPRAVFRQVSGAGHMLHYAEPERIADCVDLMAAWKPAVAAE